MYHVQCAMCIVLAKLIDTLLCMLIMYNQQHMVVFDCKCYLIFTQAPSFCNSPWARVKY